MADLDKIAGHVVTAIKAATAPIWTRLAALEARSLVPGPPGPAGANGRDGAPGLEGKDGAPGPKGDAGERGADGPAGPPGPPGRDGRDGKDGAPGLNGKDGRDGADGKDGAPGVNGRDGADGLNGKDGAPGTAGRDGTLEGLKAVFDGERTITLCFKDGTPIEGGVIRFPGVIYRGVFSASRTYEAGDQVTCAGSTWVAKTTTTQRPDEDGDGARDWTLCSKRGPEGKRGPAGPKGLDGKDGAPGRDLTQLGSDGRKW